MKMTIPQHLKRTVTLAALPDGVDGIKATLALMVNLSRQSKRTMDVRDVALSLVQVLHQKDWYAEVGAIQEYVRDAVRYVKDIVGIETLSTPIQTLHSMQGDCDDKALLTSALLESIGHPTRFVAVGKQSDYFEHVLVETLIGSRWVAVETTEPVPVGWYPTAFPYRLVYSV
jgi:transglutaminase-like putative cysteine protease